ncbi:hypothetical protein AZE42_11913 [Rhizopogon vesiculosus]|uniref:Uncharacterized protein n=1 Tax=Rhizopogon vesiculosus TaxID=180088 RepID=A0A1J8QB84_9AGAM|nr:hypothetical protein AZE42_11913 [Rhizopogon vesiculosus]
MVDSLLGYYNEKVFGNEKEPSRRLPRTPNVQTTMIWLQWSDNSLHRLPNLRIHLFRRVGCPPPSQLVPPASPSADVVHSPKRQVAASPERSPTPEASVHSRERNDVLQPLENIFDDDSPLREEEEATQLAKCTRNGGCAQPKKPQRSTRKSRK